MSSPESSPPAALTSWSAVLPRRDLQEVEYRARWAPALTRLRPWGDRLVRLIPEAVGAWWPFPTVGDVVFRLRLTDVDGTERDLEVRKMPFRIGRGAACHLQLPDPTVSTEHAEIQVERGTAWLMDLRSTNGTRKNGQRLEPLKPEPLQPGDVLEVGRYRLVFVGMEPAEPRPSARGEVQSTGLQPLRLARPFRALAHPQDRWLRVQWDGWTAWVRVPALWMRACWDYVTGTAWDDTWGPDPMEEGMAQFLAFQIAAALSERAGVPFQVSGWATPEEADALTTDDAEWLYMDVWLHFPPLRVASTVLVRVEPSEPPWPSAWDDWTWPVAVWAGWIRLRVTDWQRIEPGDVLLPDVWFPAAWASTGADADLGPVYVRMGRLWHTGRLRREDGSLKLWFEKLWIRTPGDDGPMAEVERPTGEPEVVSVQDLELQVVIELDRFPTTLAEMKGWQVGQCLVLRRGPDDPVRLVIETGTQRRVLAEGRVVLVDGRLGIEILRVLTSFQAPGRA